MGILVELRPVTIHLRQILGEIEATTALATVKVPENDIGFLTQGIAYSPIPFELEGTDEIKAKFHASLNTQFCLGHLKANVSLFLYNYLMNKSVERTNGVSFSSLLTELSIGNPRILFCGAGPSLYESWDFVQFCLESGYARVIAGGSAIKAFSDKGLSPDLCLVCDPNPSASSRSDVPTEFQESTILLAGSGTNPSFLNKWSGPMALTNGMSAFPIGEYMEPGKETISEGGIGVSTFLMNLVARLPNTKELLLLGVDLSPTEDNTLYPASLGFDSELQGGREHIWSCEASALGVSALSMGTSVKNLSQTGRHIENTERVPVPHRFTEKSTALHKLKLLSEKGNTFIPHLHQLYTDLCDLNVNGMAESPLYSPLLETYHLIYLSRALYTGEYQTDSIVLRVEYLKNLVGGLL